MMLNHFQATEIGSNPVFYGEDGQAMTILEFYGMQGSIMGSKGACLGFLSGLIGLFALVGMLGLKLVRHDKR